MIHNSYGILGSNKQEQTTDKSNMDESQEHFVQNNLDTKKKAYSHKVIPFM